MNWITGVVVYFLIWWLVLFAVLPWGVQREENPQPGHDPGAPVQSTRTLSGEGSQQGQAEGPFSGWSVVEAPDAEAAARLLSDHPFIGRGGVLQINEPVEF